MYAAEDEHVGLWSIYNAGWHCSWCFSPQGIRKKLLDAPHSDFPRYGDFQKKTEDKYIQRLIKNGIYFDLNEFRSGPEVSEKTDPEFAPRYVLDNPEQFGYLIKNPFEKLPIA